MQLSGIDLNLLVTLDALLREQNVTRAAKAVNLSQPAMSNALARLRRLFDDPLFVRTPAGMQPTPRALALAPGLHAALRQIEGTVLSRETFDSAKADLTINIATHDYEQLVLLPALTTRLAREAPGIKLHMTIPKDRLPIEDLYLGKIDLAIGVHSEVLSGLYQTPLFSENFLCLLRSDHPEFRRGKGRLTLPRYTALEHLLISPFGGMTGSVDHELTKLSLTRQVKVAVPHFALAPWILLNSDYVLTLPARVATHFAVHLPLRTLKPPLELPPFTEFLAWHERSHADPAHKWFRSILKEVATKNRP